MSSESESFSFFTSQLQYLTNEEKLGHAAEKIRLPRWILGGKKQEKTGSMPVEPRARIPVVVSPIAGTDT